MTETGRDLQRDAVADLVGALAYGELTAFTRLAADARLAPTLADEIVLASYASSRFHDFRLLSEHLVALDIDPESAMAPFVVPLDAFHDMTEPGDWLEGLVKAYVGDGIARDFYREMAELLGDGGPVGGPSTRDLLHQLLTTQAEADVWAVDRIRAAISTDPSVGGRLALWARRLVGEALSQTQRVAADRDVLLELVGERSDLGEMMRLLTRVTDAHTARMGSLGLSA